MLVEHLLRRRLLVGVMLAADDVVRTRHLRACDPPAGLDVAVVVPGDRIPPPSSVMSASGPLMKL